MSKTDKTKPFWVQIMNREIAVSEYHDHINGVCEIKGQKPSRDHVDWKRGECHFTWEYDGKNVGCGCKMCTMQFERKQDNRRTRRAKKKVIREWEE